MLSAESLMIPASHQRKLHIFKLRTLGNNIILLLVLNLEQSRIPSFRASPTQEETSESQFYIDLVSRQ